MGTSVSPCLLLLEVQLQVRHLRRRLRDLVHAVLQALLGVAAQVEIETKIRQQFTIFCFKLWH